ncbi:Glycoprotein 3-alpha-L-fucosyltransferase A [Halotydeus destructor]|nr:Glycoprotein 3-alpha-L-fucosyltransferase A [Halotydeus destructor]
MPRMKARTVLISFTFSCFTFVLVSYWADKFKVRLVNSNLVTYDEPVSLSLETRNALTDQHSKAADIDAQIIKLTASTFNRSLSSLLNITGQRPWFMSKGYLRPKNHLYPFHNLPLWPQDVADDDRIVNQLMYVPENYVASEVKRNKKIVLFFGRGGWNAQDLPMGQRRFLKDNCPVNTCELSMDLKEAAVADAIFFKDKFQWPKHKRHPSQLWILFLLECPVNTATFANLHNVINWTATYRHDSDIVAPYEKFYSPFSEPGHSLQVSDVKEKTKKVAWFVSNCAARNGRLEYARELSKYIQVDIYGACGSKRCPRSDAKHCFDLLNHEYKFYLAFENSNCKDYITEKFYINGLSNDIVPIVMGATKQDYVRASPPNSFIHVDDFASPRELASYLDKLDHDDGEYRKYLQWKGTGEFVNTFFWCRLCAMLHAPRAERESHSYEDMHDWWAGPDVCRNKRHHY